MYEHSTGVEILKIGIHIKPAGPNFVIKSKPTIR